MNPAGDQPLGSNIFQATRRYFPSSWTPSPCNIRNLYIFRKASSSRRDHQGSTALSSTLSGFCPESLEFIADKSAFLTHPRCCQGWKKAAVASLDYKKDSSEFPVDGRSWDCILDRRATEGLQLVPELEANLAFHHRHSFIYIYAK